MSYLLDFVVYFMGKLNFIIMVVNSNIVNKVDKVVGYGFFQEDFIMVLFNKLNGIEVGVQINQNVVGVVIDGSNIYIVVFEIDFIIFMGVGGFFVFVNSSIGEIIFDVLGVNYMFFVVIGFIFGGVIVGSGLSVNVGGMISVDIVFIVIQFYVDIQVVNFVNFVFVIFDMLNELVVVLGDDLNFVMIIFMQIGNIQFELDIMQIGVGFNVDGMLVVFIGVNYIFGLGSLCVVFVQLDISLDSVVSDVVINVSDIVIL